MTEVTAKLRSARVSGQKARLIADQIRGREVGEALDILSQKYYGTPKYWWVMRRNY